MSKESEESPQGFQTTGAIGKTTATENQPSTVDRFSFWLSPETIVNPFDFVTVDHLMRTRTIGIVREMSTITDAPSHLSNYVSSEFGNVAITPNTNRVTTTIAEAAVLANFGKDSELEINMPVENDRPVRFATESEIGLALGAEDLRVPVSMGLIEMSNGVKIPIKVDGRYLLGPEAAHVNVSGISGLATKTSYLMFLVQSILKAYGPEKIGVVIFNVKQQDLLHVDEDAPDLETDDLEIYKALNIEPKPFQNVTYFLPRGQDGSADSEHEPRNSKIYGYSLRDCVSEGRNNLDLLFSQVRDPDYTIASILEHLREQNWPLHFGREVTRDDQVLRTPDQEVQTWEDLRLYDHYPGNIRAGSRGKFRRHLQRLTSSNLFVPTRRHEVYLGEEIKKLRGGQAYVIDIFKVSPSEERAAFVVGDVLRSIEEMYSEGSDTWPGKVLLLVDELNKYAPRSLQPAPVAQQVIEIARTGRSRGAVLFGAEQFKSEVHDQVYENAATHIIGRTGSSELSSHPYSFLEKETKNNVTRLEKGELVLVHAAFRQPVKIVFPRPSYMRQEAVVKEPISPQASHPDGAFSES
jgi:DNA helicase HerA-like ATPase